MIMYSKSDYMSNWPGHCHIHTPGQMILGNWQGRGGHDVPHIELY
jgi:hypothetical protein